MRFQEQETKIRGWRGLPSSGSQKRWGEALSPEVQKSSEHRGSEMKVKKVEEVSSDELVLMACEDGKVFAFEGNKLHLVSNNLEELFKNGLQFPGT
ncbi:hypothetical protein AMELA_G00188250 [Ameiurus melas]|uniref:Uncharacterized protein n=1 Tax=Ameiurus melas TaxID=219545 RepID=A0A7J6A841_AMEME|nr:hypothetical protein AMELA_G00188250 [Ameiurus melas]